MVQGETDTCYRMTADAFRREMDRRGAFYVLMTFYSHAVVAAGMQATACNAVHSVEQRLARWLLMAHDRMASDEFPLTQEFAAMMLGTSRQTVTIVAGILQIRRAHHLPAGTSHRARPSPARSGVLRVLRLRTALFEAVIDGARQTILEDHDNKTCRRIWSSRHLVIWSLLINLPMNHSKNDDQTTK